MPAIACKSPGMAGAPRGVTVVETYEPTPNKFRAATRMVYVTPLFNPPIVSLSVIPESRTTVYVAPTAPQALEQISTWYPRSVGAGD